MSEASSTVSSCHGARQTISKSTKISAAFDSLGVREETRRDKSWLLHHANAPAHKALTIRQLLAEKNITVLEQPPYSPDLAPCDFFLFPKLKGIIKGTRFVSLAGVATSNIFVATNTMFVATKVLSRRNMDRLLSRQKWYKYLRHKH